MRIKYTKEILEEIIKESFSMRSILLKLNLKESGGNYSYLKNRIKLYKIDISHFTGQAHKRGKIDCKRKTPEEYLVKNSNIPNSTIKERILRDGVKVYKCEKCGNSEWFGEKIPLELHHKDGDNTNNLLENLEFLCPNCHALTSNYCGRKNKRKNNYCIDCGKQIERISLRCHKCSNSRKRLIKEKPTKDQLIQDLKTLSILQIGKKYNRTDNGIRVWLHSYDIPVRRKEIKEFLTTCF